MAHGLVVACLFQQGDGFGDGRAPALGVFAHGVESEPVVGVLHLPEGLHASVQQVRDDGIAVLAVVKGFPALFSQALCARGNGLCRGEAFCAAEWRHGVEVNAENQIHVEGQRSREVAVYDIRPEVNLVVFLIREVEVRVAEGKRGRGIAGAIHGPGGLHVERRFEGVVVCRILLHRDAEVAGYAFVGLELNGQSTFTYRGGMFLYSFIGMILMATIIHPGAGMNKWFTNPVFHWVGQRSYGIYVYQYPVMVFYERLINVGNHPLLNAFVEIIIILVVSEVSYRLIERPFAQYQWSKLPADLQHVLETHHFSWQSGAKMMVSALVVVIAFIGFCQPNRAPKKTAVQQRIEQNHQAAEEHNKKIAKGDNVAEASGNTSKLQKQYDLTPAQIKAAQKLKVTAIGDSVMADAADSIQKLMPNAYVDAQVGRQGSAAPDVIKQLKADGHLNKIVILNLGTNGPMTQDTLDDILSAIGSGHQIYWVTAHVPTKPWQQTVNNEIKDLAKKHKNIHVVDWNKASQGHSDWFASDNVHMGPSGNDHFARLIAKTILTKK